LGDIDEKSLRDAANALPRTDDCMQVVSDVSIEEDMARLARQTFERFGAVHLLFNNAGVVLARPLWEYTRSDWEWLLGVNAGFRFRPPPPINQ
jgi:NAD(P)-dependent dehydrogenase (short-subunit alcohol dehydrogenase family)